MRGAERLLGSQSDSQGNESEKVGSLWLALTLAGLALAFSFVLHAVL